MAKILTLRRTLIALPLLLIAALLLLARFVLPGVIQREASRYVLEHTGHHLSLDEPEVHLFGPQVVLRNLKLTEADGRPLLSFASLDVQLASAPLLKGDLRFEDIRLVSPRATVVVRSDGRLNWSTLIERLQGPPKPAEKPAASKPLPVEIHSLAISGAEIDAGDERVGFAARTTPLDLTLSDLSTTGDASGHYRLAAVALGGHLTLEGQAELKDIKAAGTLQIEGLDLAQLAPLIEAHAPLRIPAGVAGLSTHYQMSYQPARLDLTLDAIQASLKGLTVQQAGKDRPTLKVASISLDQGHFELGPQLASLGGLKIEGSALALPRPGGPDVTVTLGSLNVEQVSADLGKHRAEVARVKLADGAVATTRLADGRIDLLMAVDAARSGASATPPAGASATPPAGAGATPPAGASATLPATDSKVAPAGEASRSAHEHKPEAATDSSGGPAQPWHFKLGELALDGFRARFRDETVQPAAEFAIEALDLGVTGVSDDLAQPLKLQGGFKVASGGSFETSGTVVPGKSAANLQFRLSALALPPAQPYLSQFLRLRLTSGQFSTGGQVELGGAGGPRFQGDFALEKLRLLEVGNDNLFFGLKSFGTRKLTASTRRLDIPQLNLVGLDTQLLIAKDKSINATRILVPRPGSAAAAGTAQAASRDGAGSGGGARAGAPAQPAPGKAAQGAARERAAPGTRQAARRSAPTSVAGAFQANIDQLRISESALDFADQSLALPFGTHIHDLHGVINGLSTRSDARGQILLDGQVDDYGSAHAEGQLDLFNPTGYTDLKVVFRNVEMTRLTPYSATFAGRRISSGKLSLDLEYKIKDRQLEGDNQVVMDRLTLGERVDTPGATSLPLDLAIAILEDSDGRIDLGLPVSGSLDDPQFSYGRIIWKAIVNVIGKIVLSPFRALGALFGGSGEKFESVVFLPGSPQLAPPEREKLVKIAAALAKRPGIALTAPAPWSDADRLALQDLQVRRAIAARAGQGLAPDEDPGPTALRSADVQAAIEAEFAARQGSEPLAALRKAAQPADGSALPDSWYQDLIARMRTAQAVPDSDLQALGQQRARNVAAGLEAAGIAASRLSVGDPVKVELQDGNVALKLAPGTAQAAAAATSATPAAAAAAAGAVPAAAPTPVAAPAPRR